MSFIGTQIFNSIFAQLKELKNDELKRFIETWGVVNYIESPTKWHVGWKCIPLGVTFTLLQEVESEGDIKKHPETNYSYFNDDSFTKTAKLQNKKLIRYNDPLLKSLISHLPTQDEAGKGMYLTQMMCGSSLGEVIYPGYYSGQKEQWEGVNEHVSMFLSSYQSLDTKNSHELSGSKEKSFWMQPEEYPFHYFTHNCSQTNYMIGLVYE